MINDRKRSVLLAGDAFASAAALALAALIRFGGLPEEDFGFTELLQGVVFCCAVLGTSFFVELYSSGTRPDTNGYAWRVPLSLVLSFLVLTTVFYVLPSIMIGRGVLVLSLVAFGALQYLLHTGYQVFIDLPRFARKVLILGTGPLANQMGAVVVGSAPEYKLSGFVRCSADPVSVPHQSILADETGLVEAVKREKAEHLVVSLSERRGVFPIHDVMKCRLSGVEVTDAPSFYEQVTGKLWVENLKPSSFIFSNGFRVGWFTRRCKRTFDIVASCIGLIVVLPLFPLVAVLIKLDSRGPVFFSQERVGEGEKTFRLYKFRTMAQDAEARTGAVWATENDPRVTSLGRFLRKSRIDELPQFFNVIRGDMSLVGPRPERPEFVQKLKEAVPYYSERHFVKPGVTGWAQVRYPYGASVEDALEKLRYDLYYMKNFSLAFDLVILADTVKVVLFGRGGR